MSTASSRDKQHAGFLIGALAHSGANREGGGRITVPPPTQCREGWRNGECRRGLRKNIFYNYLINPTCLKVKSKIYIKQLHLFALNLKKLKFNLKKLKLSFEKDEVQFEKAEAQFEKDEVKFEITEFQFEKKIKLKLKKIKLDLKYSKFNLKKIKLNLKHR